MSPLKSCIFDQGGISGGDPTPLLKPQYQHQRTSQLISLPAFAPPQTQIKVDARTPKSTAYSGHLSLTKSTSGAPNVTMAARSSVGMQRWPRFGGNKPFCRKSGQKWPSRKKCL